MKIAIVNDVPAIRSALARVISEQTPHQVIWSAEDGLEAVEQCRVHAPDLVLMDLIMPHMNGVEATRRIMESSPTAILVVTASVNSNASLVFEALGAGALDAVNTPTVQPGDRSGSVAALVRKIGTIEKLIARSDTGSEDKKTPCPAPVDSPLPLIAIGSSTGGPSALARVFSELPPDLAAAIVVIQHVDSEFAEGLAEWLDSQTPLKVRIAEQGDRPAPGQILVAGTSDHLMLQSNQRLGYSAEPRDYVYRPSVNVFFESAIAHWSGPLVGVLLTGMGRDGATGLLSMRTAGMHTIAQDSETSAVYGMPKVAAELGAACSILGIDQIARELSERIGRLHPECASAGATK